MTDIEVRGQMNNFKLNNPRRLVISNKPFKLLSKKLWISLLLSLNIDQNLQWANLSKMKTESISRSLTKSSYLIKSRGPFGEEFVTAGGVSLNEINFNICFYNSGFFIVLFNSRQKILN